MLLIGTRNLSGFPTFAVSNCPLSENMKSWTWESPMPNNETIDWSDCAFVEIKPDVQSGAPVLRGTRMPVDAIVDNFDYGLSVAEIAEQFELPPDRIQAILTYAKSHRSAHHL